MAMVKLPAWAGQKVESAFAQCWNAFSDAQVDGKVLGYDPPDWRRLAVAAKLVSGERMLEIGPGAGVLLNVLGQLRPGKEMVALDIHRHSRLRVPDGVRFEIGSIQGAGLPGRLGTFDCIVCMEVLEHLEVPDLPPALDNLRAMSRGRLITTVPYEEPEPVWWHDRPGGHRQSFSRQRLAQLFPKVMATRLPRYGVDWIMMVEDAGMDYGFTELPPEEFVEFFSAR